MIRFLLIANVIFCTVGAIPYRAYPSYGVGQRRVGGARAARCIATMDDALPACLTKYFLDPQNTIMMDGNGNTCTERLINGQALGAKKTVDELFTLAETAFSGWHMPVSQNAAKGNCETSSQRLESVFGIRDYGTYKIAVTNGIPAHCYLNGQDSPNPNWACEHYRAIKIPNTFTKAWWFRASSMGPVGIALSGAFFYNHKSAESSCNAAAITEKPNFDTCDGHADPGNHYHYHKTPACIPGYDSCGLMGYLFDGVPVYGKCSLTIGGQSVELKTCYKRYDGKNGCDTSHYYYDSDAHSSGECNLDEANGYTVPASGGVGPEGNAISGYAYFFTPEYPFIMPGYWGAWKNMINLNVST